MKPWVAYAMHWNVPSLHSAYVSDKMQLV